MDKLFVNLKLPSYMYVYVGAPGYTLPTTRYTFQLPVIRSQLPVIRS